jgi:hypothetical protein
MTNTTLLIINNRKSIPCSPLPGVIALADTAAGSDDSRTSSYTILVGPAHFVYLHSFVAQIYFSSLFSSLAYILSDLDIA